MASLPEDLTTPEVRGTFLFTLTLFCWNSYDWGKEMEKKISKHRKTNGFLVCLSHKEEKDPSAAEK